MTGPATPGTPAAPVVPAALAVEDLRFAYTRAAEELFDGLTHAFTPGAVTALTGPSGRGKSTLLYVLGLMLTPTSGVVRLGDVDASTRPDRERSRLRATSVGFVFQDSELDPSRPILDSVVEPGLYAGLERQTLEDRARALLERFGLAHRADHRPGQVSGGQAQRVAVCRALVNAPAVVLADEPTGNLDPDNAGLVMDALADAAAEGRTVVVATHDPAVVARADEVVWL
ncbi:ABC transporter ATP-binding protein [Micrococcus luteus]|uniref:ABC transporter ATP-binding protein n=1 Tax=Micrococcus luteus TaxID=1270 RepID=UPI001C23B80C|nr:ABC transporter ATP-binding protein [Micrococcus luteus]MBU8649517.1 ABC transporter ATP-binding protein [Micrococcus luteus]